MDEMEKLLAQLKAEYEEEPASPSLPQTPTPSQQKRSQPLSSSPLDKLLTELKAEIEQPQSYSPPVSKSSSAERSHHSDDSTLKDLQAEFKAQEQLEKQRQQQALQEQQRVERERQQQKKQALKQQAQEWLKKLNPRSEEGMWFEEFSYSYEDKLEAAMHYLEALRETQR
jgi:4-alpha-glucanotransferase